MNIRCWIIAGLFSIASASYSDLAVSNLGAISFEDAGITNAGTGAYVGNRFTTGSNGDYAINFVTLSMGDHFTTDGDFEVRLYTDNGSDAPGSLLAELNGPTKPAENIQVQYTLSSPLDIDANTSYWLIAIATGGASDFGWRFTDDTTETSPLGWTIDGSADLNTDFTVDARYSGSQVFNVDVIPEPATMGLIGAFGGALLFINRKFIM
jgi:hypothetical protein